MPWLEPVDSYQMQVVASDGNNVYGRGSTGNGIFYRQPKYPSTSGRTTLIDFSTKYTYAANNAQTVILGAWVFGADMFCTVSLESGYDFVTDPDPVNILDAVDLWYSADSGATWSLSAQLGVIAGVRTKGTEILDRGITVGVDASGTKVFLYGEYEGVKGVGRPCRSYYSYNGVTWVNRLDNNGLAQHIHAVMADPYYPNSFWYAFGDTSGNEGIVNVDSTTVIPSDTLPAAMITLGYTGFADGNAYRALDFVFTEDWIYHSVDSPESSLSGIFRFNRECTIHEKLVDIPANINHAGWTGCTYNGKIFFCTALNGDDSGIPGYYHSYYGIWGSDDGQTFEEIERAYVASASTGGILPKGMLQTDDGYLYFSGDRIAGKRGDQATCCKIHSGSKGYIGSIAPVYFISPSGTDQDNRNAEAGWRPSNPWKTLDYALQRLDDSGNGNITYGAVLVLASGTYSNEWLKINLVPDGIPAADLGQGIHIRSAGGGLAESIKLNGVAVRFEGVTFTANAQPILPFKARDLMTGRAFIRLPNVTFDVKV